jgi:hypothetical protein
MSFRAVKAFNQADSDAAEIDEGQEPEQADRERDTGDRVASCGKNTVKYPTTVTTMAALPIQADFQQHQAHR